MNKRKKRMSKKRIYKKSLAIQLMQAGCHLVEIEENPRNKILVTYVFEQNQEFRRLLTELTQ